MLVFDSASSLVSAFVATVAETSAVAEFAVAIFGLTILTVTCSTSGVNG